MYVNYKMPSICFISKLYHYNNVRFKRLVHLHKNITEVILVTTGKSEYVVDGKNYTVVAGDLIFCQEDLTHYEITTKNQKMDYYCIGITNLDQLDLSQHIYPIYSTGSRYGIIKELFENVYQAIAANQTEYEKSLECLLNCILDVLRHGMKTESMERNLQDSRFEKRLSYNVYQYLSKNYDNAICLKQLSDTFCASESLISHQFSTTYNISPMQFLQSCRIGITQSDLIITNRQIIDISLDAGYNSLSNYNATFYNKIGMSPRQYRKYYRSLDYIQLLNL